MPTHMGLDQVRSEGYVPPYVGPLDLDNWGNETDEMQRAFLRLHATEPALRSAIDGASAAVASLDVSCQPRDKTQPNDVAAAKFVMDTVEDSPHGWDGAIMKVLRPARLFGWSLNEIVLQGVSTPHGPMAGLKHLANKNTLHFRLRLDAYRNILGVVNKVRGLRTHDPKKCIVYSHLDLFDNPFGQADTRAAYRSANLINEAYKLWHLCVRVYGQPFLTGKVSEATRRQQMEQALQKARANGYIVFEDGDDVEVLNFAAAVSFDAFERMIEKCREEIFLAVRGAYLPFLEGNQGERGDTKTHKVASDSMEYLIAKAMGRILSRQLAPHLVTSNFPVGTGIPRVVVGGVNWTEAGTLLDLVKKKKDLKGSVSMSWLDTASGIPPAEGPADELPGTPDPSAAVPSQPGQPGQQTPANPDEGAAAKNPIAQVVEPDDEMDQPFQQFAAGQRLGCVMAPLPQDLAGRVRAVAATIPDQELAEKGREQTPHVTAFYGLLTADVLAVAAKLRNLGPVKVRLGQVSVFKGQDSGKPYDVLKIDVASPDLVRMNRLLATLPHADPEHGYRPHVTIAYLKPGLGGLYVGRVPTVQQTVTISRLTFKDPTGRTTTIPLTDYPHETFNLHSGGAAVGDAADEFLTEVGALGC